MARPVGDSMTEAIRAHLAGRKDIYKLAKEYRVSASGLYRALRRLKAKEEKTQCESQS